MVVWMKSAKICDRDFSRHCKSKCNFTKIEGFRLPQSEIQIPHVHILYRSSHISYGYKSRSVNTLKGTKTYGDPYGMMNFLFNARYREGDEMTDFILKYENVMNDFNTVLNISLDDTVASVFLFNAMPASWNSEMRIGRGNREIIPYVELESL